MAERRAGFTARGKFSRSIDPDAPYPMDLPRLGHAVIVNNITSVMPGSTEDVKALTSSYEAVGFDVQVHTDCTAQRMRKLKRWILDNKNHEDSNTFLMTAICHGNKQGHLLDKHMNRAWDTEEFVADLSEVETLAGKPKILIIQSCRGSEWRGRVAAPGTLAEDEDLTTPHLVPDKADLFLAYASVPGYRAYAGDDDGSVYLQCFATFLQEEYMKRPLDRIYLMVKQAMIRATQGEQEMVQCSEERNSLTRVLHFGHFHGAAMSQPKEVEMLKKEMEAQREIHLKEKVEAERQQREMMNQMREMKEMIRRMEMMKVVDHERELREEMIKRNKLEEELEKQNKETAEKFAQMELENRGLKAEILKKEEEERRNKKEVLSDEMILEVSGRLTDRNDIRHLGAKLNIKEHIIDKIFANHSSDITKVAHELLKEWLKRQISRQEAYHDLGMALIDIDLNLLAVEVLRYQINV